MLSPEILQALKGYTANLQRNVTFVLQTGEHAKRQELLEFLSELTAVSDKLKVEQRDTQEVLRSPISFSLEVDGKDTGIVFSGIPGGHEFNSLILAVLHAGGTALKLDSGIQQIVRKVDEPLSFEVFVSLSCHNCPDVVQTLNQFAVLNEHIRTEMIDGGLYPELIAQRDIQGVPCVYLNGKLFANGKVDAAQLLDSLTVLYPHLTEAKAEASLPTQDVIVIGGGPAGVAAAIYTARKGLAVTLVADRVGGQVKDTMGIENLISVPKTTGPQLTGALQRHMNDYDITVKEHVRVASLENNSVLKKITLSTREIINARTVIIATGARWRELNIPGEKENIGKGVAYCPHCDGPFFKGKDVAVIGGGNSGIEAALDLAGIVRSVKVFEFLPELKADKILVDKAVAADNIEIFKNVAVKSINAENGKVASLSYEERLSGKLHTQPLDGVFVQIGLVPNSQFVKGVVEMTPYGEIIVDEKCRTSAPGIFACGDVTTVPFKQIVISMGEGAKAALSAFEYMLKQTQPAEPKAA